MSVASALNQQKKEIDYRSMVTMRKGKLYRGKSIVKGTQLGTATGMDGKYSLTLPEGKENHILVFTMVGMETKEVVVGKQTGINVVMKDVVSELDDVIVTGYYTQPKNSFYWGCPYDHGGGIATGWKSEYPECFAKILIHRL